VPVSDLSLSVRNPILVYSLLTLYGLLSIFLIVYVHRKFRTAAKTLKVLENPMAKRRIQNTQTSSATRRKSSRSSRRPLQDSSRGCREKRRRRTRHAQSDVSMAKRGMRAGDIARACGLRKAKSKSSSEWRDSANPAKVPGDAFPAYRQLSGSL
jgi:hypothetical protein